MYGICTLSVVLTYVRTPKGDLCIHTMVSYTYTTCTHNCELHAMTPHVHTVQTLYVYACTYSMKEYTYVHVYTHACTNLCVMCVYVCVCIPCSVTHNCYRNNLQLYKYLCGWKLLVEVFINLLHQESLCCVLRHPWCSSGPSDAWASLWDVHTHMGGAHPTMSPQHRPAH